jgi:tetratricopeptide (TPR) repeat protein
MSTEHAIRVTSDRNKTIGLLLIVLLGLGCTFLLSRWIDARRPPPDPNVVDENLYLNGKTARRISLGFNGLGADWYWMRSLQYVGGKIINLPDNVVLDNLGQLNLKLLPSLLDTATTLDPEFLDPYEYAAIVLPAVDVDQAIRITLKGIEANPSAWRLYQHLGYIYWQQQNYAAAAETYGRGAQIPGAPEWMLAMKARMAAEGGSRSTAREIYTRMFEQSTDVKVKDMARRRLLQVDAMDQIDALQKVLTVYKERFGRCPATWKEIEPVFRSMRLQTGPTGAPLDPSGTPYVFGKSNCEVQLSDKSEIPGK